MTEYKPVVLKNGKLALLAAADRLPAINCVLNNRIGETSGITRSANSFSQVGGLAFTLAAGNYFFLANMDVTDGLVNGSGEFCFAKNGTTISGSERSLESNSALLGLVTLSTNYTRYPFAMSDIFSCAANDIISIQYRSKNGQTISIANRNFLWLSVG